MNYTEIAKINVNDHVEKKNNLSYLSWAWAVDQLMRLDESATWEYSEPKMFGETMMVFCTVNAFGRSRTAQLPVMDYKNKAIPNPDAFQVNTAMQRCLAKAIALHGLGLYIYAGEDIPQLEGPQNPIKPSDGAEDRVATERKEALERVYSTILDCLEEDMPQEAVKAAEALTDPDEKVYVWDKLDSKQRSLIKRTKQEMALRSQ